MGIPLLFACSPSAAWAGAHPAIDNGEIWKRQQPGRLFESEQARPELGLYRS